MTLLGALLIMHRIHAGAEVLAARDFADLKGKNVGLVTNHTAMLGQEHLVDLLHRQDGVKVVALFGPEHGIRGAADAGAAVSDSVDERTGIPTYSLYGKNRRPTMEMLSGCDVLVYDIQDVGARFYTYISTLGLCMQSAAEARIPFVILDRPNPLGGVVVEGPVLEKGNESFVGQYPIPTRYGLTAGELAGMVKGEHWMPGLENLDLRVVRMQGWRRSMLWPETGLVWVSPSPNIPDFETCLVYPGTCLFEATTASEGRGTKHPFVTLGTHGIDPESLAEELNAAGMPGVLFEPARFTPRSIPGMSTSPKLMDRPLAGVRIRVTDPGKFQSVRTGLEVMSAFYRSVPMSVRSDFFRPDSLARLSGTRSLIGQIQAGLSAEEIASTWDGGIKRFLELSAKYLLYK